MYDYVIKNGKVVDGTKNPGYFSDIGIRGTRIAKIGVDLKGEKIIDASEMVVCPGFIDMHSHTDFVLPFYSTMDSFVRQGITTCVVGMCGSGLAPLHPDKVEEFKRDASTFIPLFSDLKIVWHTFAEYLEYMEKVKVPANLVFFVGYENVRIAGGAGHENRVPTARELEEMKEYVAEALKAGAFGMSTGLIYAPQVYAGTEEIVELAQVVADYEGMYFSHIRGEGEAVVDAVQEFIEIVEKSGCRGGQIAHHKISGAPYWGASVRTLQLIEEANKKGVRVTCDLYPYKRGCSSLVTALPPWAQEGGHEMIMERLQNPDVREQIRNEIMQGVRGAEQGWENWINVHGFSNLYVASVTTEKWKDTEGKSISEVTTMKGNSDDWETFFDLLIDEELGVQITLEIMCREDIERIMTSRYSMVGTDGIGMPQNTGLGGFHPRFFGTYPRILKKYVREQNLLVLEDAIRRMSSFPAQTLGLQDRGLVKENMSADLVVFDPETVTDKATYEEPHQFPEGICHVMVNGTIVVENGEQHNVFPGKVLRRPSAGGED